MRLSRSSTSRPYLLIAVLVTAILFLACDDSATGDDDNVGDTFTEVTEDRGTIKTAFDSFPDTEAINAVAEVMLNRLGYEMEIIDLDPGIAYASLAEGDIDLYSGGYLPASHRDYLAEYKDQFEALGPLHWDVVQGIGVPEYMSDYVEVSDVKGDEDVFNNEVVGNVAGAGNMRLAQSIIDQYDLDMTLIESSDAAEAAAIKKAVEAEEPIAFAAYYPHWWFGEWPLRFLEDDKGGVVPPPDGLFHLVREGFVSDYPEAHLFYQNFQMSGEQHSSIMSAIQAGADPEDVANEFIDANPDLVAEWLVGQP